MKRAVDDLTNGTLAKWKKLFPDLDEISFTHGFVAGVNNLLQILGEMQIDIHGEGENAIALIIKGRGIDAKYTMIPTEKKVHTFKLSAGKVKSSYKDRKQEQRKK